MTNNTNNPLLANLKLPGRTFQLPSRGALYNNGELDAQDGEIHIHAMAALDEITLKNSDLLFSGTALDDVVRTCAPQIKKPGDLFGRDIDALMIFLRLVTYGPEFPIKVKHGCKDAKEHDYVVDIEQLAAEMQYLDPTIIKDQYVADIDGQKVTVRPVRYRDLIGLFQDNLKRKNADKPMTNDDIKENILRSLIMIIENVDGISDPKLIEQWARRLTTPQQNRIANAVDRTNEWGPKSSTTITCKDCGKQFDIDLPLNPISFFTE